MMKPRKTDIIKAIEKMGSIVKYSKSRSTALIPSHGSIPNYVYLVN